MPRAYKCMAFKLSDGTTKTARDVAEKYGVKLSTTRTRLSNGVRDVELLSQQPQESKQNKYRNTGKSTDYAPEKTVKEKVAERNYFDPMSRLLLKTI